MTQAEPCHCSCKKGTTLFCPSQQSDWGSASFHALHQILAVLPPAAASQARAVSRHWRAVCDRAISTLPLGNQTRPYELVQLPRMFPNLQHLGMTHVSNAAITPLVISALGQLKSLSSLHLPSQQHIFSSYFHITDLGNLDCGLDLTLADHSLTLELTSLASGLQNLARLQLSYPSELTKGLPAFSSFTRLQSLNIQAGILHTSPKHGQQLLDVVTLDFPVEAIPISAFPLLGTLTQLTSLRLIGVAEDFDQAAAAQLSRLQQLQHLAIYVETATGISGLSALTSLSYLCLKGQQLHVSDDTITAIGRLRHLRALVLEGSVPHDGLDANPKLHDRLSGLASLPHLETLQFWGWLDTESVDHLSALQHLTRLTLWESVGLTPETIKSIATLRDLEYLDLSYNSLKGAEWNPIGALTALTALHLHGCRQVTDETVQGLSTLTNLQWFDISHGVMKRDFYVDHLTEEGIWMVGALTSLRDLNLTDLSSITDRAVLGLSGLTQLTQICLVGAHKFANPAENSGLLAMKNLLSLDLSRSALIDAMHATTLQPLFASLTNLKQLQFGADDFAYTLASDEPEAVEIYPDAEQNKYAKLHMPV